jgi:catechol 2,3-dioxygenase-like lactoylglutathione lyase family enzyme
MWSPILAMALNLTLVRPHNDFKFVQRSAFRLHTSSFPGGFMAIRWTHITAVVSDLERSIDFYTSMCGLTLLLDRRQQGGSTVWLGYEPPEGEQPAFILVLMKGEVKNLMEHLGFQCDSREQVDAIAAEAERLNILVDPPTFTGGAVGYWTVIRDPDGHQVEFTFGQPLKGLS